MEDFKEKHAYERAKKRVREIRSFYINLTCYCIVIPVLVVINLTFTPEYYWFPFSALGWGIGLFFHATAAFNFMPFFNRDWEERKMKEFLEQEERRKQNINKFE